MRSVRFASFVAAALVLGASSAAAQATCGATSAGTAICSPTGTQVTVTVQKIARITVTPMSAGLTAPTHLDFVSSGTTAKDDIALQAIVIRANVPWSLTATATAWTGSPYAKPVGDAAWSVTGGAPFFAFDGSPQTLNSGAATATTPTNVSYRVNWALATDIPGDYILPVLFTVSAT